LETKKRVGGGTKQKNRVPQLTRTRHSLPCRKRQGKGWGRTQREAQKFTTKGKTTEKEHHEKKEEMGMKGKPAPKSTLCRNGWGSIRKGVEGDERP